MDEYEMIIEIRQTKDFAKWFDGLKDNAIQARISQRIDRLKIGLLGDFRVIDSDIIELKFSFGPGYRVYINKSGRQLTILLVGGSKKSQLADIAKARKILKEVK